MVEMVNTEKLRAAQGYTPEANLLSMPVLKSEEARLLLFGDISSGSQRTMIEGFSINKGLTDDEIYGNIFTYSFAGHESTGHAISYAFYLFAAFPDWQEWVIEGVDQVFASGKTIDILNYEELFPYPKRCGQLLRSSTNGTLTTDQNPTVRGSPPIPSGS